MKNITAKATGNLIGNKTQDTLAKLNVNKITKVFMA